MRARTIQGNSPDLIRASLQKSMSDGFLPTLAIAFISIKQDREAIRRILCDVGIDVIGATSSGEFNDSQESHGGAVVMLLELDRTHYRILIEEIGQRTIGEAAHNLFHRAKESFEKPAFILLSTYHSASGQVIDGQSLIRHLEEVAGPQLNLFGGMAGDDVTFEGTYVFTHEQETDYGITALVLNEDRISLRGMALSGWKPIGVSRTITKSEGNLIFTIDNKPAFETYLRFLGIDPATVVDQITFFNTEGIHYPLQIERQGRKPMMCNPIGYDKEKGALICESKIEEGASFRFSTPPDFDIVETILEKAHEIKARTSVGAEALLIFSCAGRLSALGPLAEQENQGLRDIWETPMAGFYTYGEFGRSPDGKHDFHSTTNSWVVLKEK